MTSFSITEKEYLDVIYMSAITFTYGESMVIFCICGSRHQTHCFNVGFQKPKYITTSLVNIYKPAPNASKTGWSGLVIEDVPRGATVR